MRKIDEALQKSSLGTPEADRLAETVSDETAQDILRRSELPKLRARFVGALLAVGALIGTLTRSHRAVARHSSQASGLIRSELVVRHQNATVEEPSPVISNCRLGVMAHRRVQPTRLRPSRRSTRGLWIVAILDMVAVAWMLAVGNWLDQTSWLTAVITLGGHHRFVLIMALIGFMMLAGLAVPTHGFSYVNRLELTLVAGACVVSVVALAGVLSVAGVLALSALLLGTAAMLSLRR